MKKQFPCFPSGLLITLLAGLIFPFTAIAETAAPSSKELEVFQALAGEHATWAADLSSGGAAYLGEPKETMSSGSLPTLRPTAPTGGLTIIPTFDGSITGDPNAAAVEGTINQAIAIYQSLFSDPVTVRIYFRYSTTEVNGNPLPAGLLARSNFVLYQIAWGTYINALVADAQTANDASANASLPGSTLSTSILPSSAGGRAVSLNTPGNMTSTGDVGPGTFDGIITLNHNQPFQFNRPPSAGNYDALRSIEHEMDEVLGLGSSINNTSGLRPQDLFSWSGPGTRSISSSGARYFSINSGNSNIVNFNQSSNGDFGDWSSAPCPNQTNPYVQNAFSCQAQFSDVTATSPEGINLDVIGYNLGGAAPSPTPNPGGTILANISTRLSIQTGSDVLIGGFIVTGTQPKRVILRAIGPSLPLAGTISDTVLELHDSSGALLAINDDWQNGGQMAEIIATGLAPANRYESAIVATLPANNSSYTAVVRGYNDATGIGLVEVYDLDRTVNSKMANISTRGLVTTGNNVMIGGIIILGNNPARVLFRAIGPSLALVGVPNSLADTTLELHDANGNVIAFNDDWRSDQEAEIIATGLPPTNNHESAIVINLSPAAYTAIVRGFSNLTGVALVEAYQLQ